jgi:hypothetical protein
MALAVAFTLWAALLALVAAQASPPALELFTTGPVLSPASSNSTLTPRFFAAFGARQLKVSPYVRRRAFCVQLT